MATHERAMVHPSVEVDPSNDIGPNVIIEPGVTLGRGNRILANAFIGTGTSLGDENVIHMNAVIGHEPHDLAFEGEPSYTRIGNRNVIRELVTIHRGTRPESATVIGDGCFLMATSHVAHNCRLGDGVIIANGSMLGGHVEVADRAFISGLCVFHQFVRVGTLAMISGSSGCGQDAPPYMTASGRPAMVTGVNTLGLRRAGLDAETRRHLQEAYHTLYRSNLTPAQAVESLKQDPTPEVQHLAEFVASSKRGLLHPGDGKDHAGM